MAKSDHTKVIFPSFSSVIKARLKLMLWTWAHTYRQVKKRSTFVFAPDANGPKQTQIVSKIRRAARDAITYLLG
jgi:hypothetical protein